MNKWLENYYRFRLNLSYNIMDKCEGLKVRIENKIRMSVYNISYYQKKLEKLSQK